MDDDSDDDDDNDTADNDNDTADDDNDTVESGDVRSPTCSAISSTASREINSVEVVDLTGIRGICGVNYDIIISQLLYPAGVISIGSSSDDESPSSSACVSSWKRGLASAKKRKKMNRPKEIVKGSKYVNIMPQTYRVI